ncbi:prolyl oligopeptidase family serine peptidase [Alteromonas lipolytica]|uniref:Prolyl oligopeptidase n=1 Tax=Alteromonas lipolytica TaxID=1856405 RepID=A0A1E8FCC9_9ALTE|nr:prolyl oligopeptidase family serine peptidase [Alteromonas lipolytica]OFI33268.1 prolyl oligopeptidase [Alteromonas lipolytica]GGF61137.1 peptidase [Alteromonas lipolytica]
MEFIRKPMLMAMAILGLAACSSNENETTRSITPVTAETAAQSRAEAPYLWLEEVEGERALSWVRSQNQRTLAQLQADPVYPELEAKALEVVNAAERIPYGNIRHGEVYNFWQDATHIRGLWRKTPLASYAGENPDWETILDVDQLAKAEDKNWVFKGASCYTAKETVHYRCLVSLSDGGKDAVTVREFDLADKQFVDDGFILPEARTGTEWTDNDTLLVATNWGQDGSTLTESGYPTQVKRWQRGTELSEAETLFTAKKTDVGAFPFTLEKSNGTKIEAVVVATTFFTSDYFIFPAGTTDAVKLPVPPKATITGLFDDQLLFRLEQDWSINVAGADHQYKTGSLLAMPFSEDGQLTAATLPEVVFEPNDKQAIESVSMTKGQLLMTLSDNVAGKVFAITRKGSDWQSKQLALPANGTLAVSFADKDEDTVFINYEGFLTPDSLMSYSATSGEIKTLKSLPSWFNSDDLVVEQKEVASKDGTLVPFFVIHKKGIKHDGKTPTLLYGYGGFQISMRPSYSGLRGKLWLERGGAFVLANIRGGGEFGPKWHQAGLKTKRQVIYDDFIAVGEWLIDHKLTSPEHLGIQGGSNGGLLMGVMLTQRPDLWNAVIVQVPLLDMLRFHLLLAGASWVGEYGSPEIPEEREWLEKMSPYHNFHAEQEYPEPFFVTSTKDDRVHPGHARKMAKLFEAAGKPFYYYENIDGGHSAAANQQETAKRVALEFTYLTEKLMSTTRK